MQCSDEPKSVLNNIKSNVQTPASRLLRTAIVGSLVTGLSVAPQALMAQGSKALLEEVVVTATKREENSQDVPITISAFDSSQLDALKVRDLESLAVGTPNVSLDDAGTSPGYANFSIRGLGVNSSIISVDPTVGVFVDGVYLSISAGQVFDLFDLQSIEVLRGPQGTLFGRNVTGGAILINTALPGDELEAYVKGSVEGGGDGGLNRIIQGSVSGPLSETFAGKAAIYYKDDEGYFENQFDGSDIGATTEEVYRLAGVWTPSDTVEFIGRYTYQENDGDGPVGQSHRNGTGVDATELDLTTFTPNSISSDRDSFDVNIDNPGFNQAESHLASLQTNIDVAWGDGVITNILGYRAYDAETGADIDAQRNSVFDSFSWTDHEQISNELRYSGSFGAATVTTGIYAFQSDTEYHERRHLAQFLVENGLSPVTTTPVPNTPFVVQDGGGLYDVESYSVFGSVDFELTEKLVLTTGLRWTYEAKDVEIASLSSNQSVPLAGQAPCNIVDSSEGGPCTLDFVDEQSWSYVSPKVGLSYFIDDSSHLYGHWSRGIRSGGYNLRNTVEGIDPGPFDEETSDSFEIGYKGDFNRKVRLNAAVFYTIITDQQREVNFSDPDAGVAQIIANTADAGILGFEFDGTFSVTESFLLTASLGILDAEYDEVRADLNRDGVINGEDEKLELPRAPELTWSIGANYDLELGNAGYLTFRGSFAHRDESAYTDDNLGFITEQDILDVGIDFYSADNTWSVGIFGKNLLDEVKHGGDTQLPDTVAGAPAGGTFAPLAKGRIIGAEFSYNF